ncbi:MAG: hypothetical protein O7G85_11630 [Planctomycetota bacterium]|nr:hypothetical protein [Planctomycetota bacterium]
MSTHSNRVLNDSPIAGQGAFANVMQNTKGEQDLQAVRESVEQLVSSSLVLPALKTLRESTMGAGPFTPGTAEKRFGPILDQHFADEITKSANFPIIDVIVDRLARQYGLSNANSASMTREVTHA